MTVRSNRDPDTSENPTLPGLCLGAVTIPIGGESNRNRLIFYPGWRVP